ncbi:MULTISPECIES: GTPase HflX [Chitinophagaceae]|uniref:GTPase HflX n=1 Tax=Chitinophagaceae TaxID=563835 RepID=UPI001F022911|nr:MULTISPECIES: GTPase HflX [Chitinophagaceae]
MTNTKTQQKAPKRKRRKRNITNTNPIPTCHWRGPAFARFIRIFIVENVVHYMLDKSNKINKEERAVLVGVVQKDQKEHQVQEYLEELAFLAETAGAVTVKRFYQKLAHPDSRTFVGKGKLQEIAEYIKSREIDLLIFDDELNGSQISNIEKEVGIKVIDRSDLILDIFARRAKTAQAKAQVELAQYQYILPRLRGMWKHLERLGGGIGTRGPGETEIETDRRIVRDKISLLRNRLKEIDKQAYTQRKDRGEFIRVSLVGYTNVGKSTIMNLLSKSEVLAENKLFATLDTTTRKIVYESTPFLLSDTVGFIRKLPHHLVESFKSTLDEVREADILLHVVDISHPNYEDQIGVVNKTLQELAAFEKPIITIFNKMDLYEQHTFDEWLEDDTKKEILRDLEERWQRATNDNAIFISALERTNIELLRKTILDKVRELYRIRYPYKTEFFY